MNPCACGCGEMIKGKWKWGHHSRVQNISKREDVREKRSQTFRRLHEIGRLGDPWNRDLTSEDDPRIIARENHPRWKGGISKIYDFCRTRLYAPWKRPILERDGWKCRDCGATGSLHVHHDDVRFSAIYHEVVDPYLEIRGIEEELSFEEKERLVERIVRIHVDRNISGISLCPLCHRVRHSDSQDDDLDQEADQ